jgi:hypothetical protein
MTIFRVFIIYAIYRRIVSSLDARAIQEHIEMEGT